MTLPVSSAHCPQPILTPRASRNHTPQTSRTLYPISTSARGLHPISTSARGAPQKPPAPDPLGVGVWGGFRDTGCQAMNGHSALTIVSNFAKIMIVTRGGRVHSFSKLLAPNFMPPVDALQNLNGSLRFEPYLPEKTFFDSKQPSQLSSSAPHSHSAVLSYRFSAELRSPPRKASLDLRPCQNSLPQHQAVVASQDGWPAFRCNLVTKSSACSKTARIHLDGLEQAFNNDGAWKY